MPVTIQPKEWEKKTAKPIWRNPVPGGAPIEMTMIYNRLLNYHYARRVAPGSAYERMYLVDLKGYLDSYTHGKATKVVNGHRRYRDYRDRNGMISKLERQVDLAIIEFDRGSVTLSRASQPSMPAPTTRPPQRRSARPVASMPGIDRMTAINPRESNRPGSAGSLQDLFGENASVASGRCSNAASLRVLTAGPARAVQALTTARVHADAFETAAQFIRMGTGERRTAQDVRDAVPTGQSGIRLSSGSVFHDLCLALIELNLNVFHQQNVGESELCNVLKNATNHRPVMICVGAGGAALNRVIICHGQYFSGNGMDIEAAFKAIDVRVARDKSVLFGNGEFEAEIGALTEHLNWQPSLGYIKF